MQFEWFFEPPPVTVCDNALSNNSQDSFRVGWYHGHLEHVALARELEHPCESDAAVPDDLKIALFRVLTKGLHVVAKERTDFLRDMINRAKDLKEEEARFKSTLDPEVADVVKQKRLLLFRWVLEEISFEDPTVLDYMENGVKLVGWEEDSPLYSKRIAPPSITEAQLSSDGVEAKGFAWQGDVTWRRRIGRSALGR